MKEATVLLLFLVPVLVLVTYTHRYLQRYAPSNMVIARAAKASRWRSTLLLAIVTTMTLAAMHLLAEAVAGGAPGWLNLVVLMLAWDTLKLAFAAALAPFVSLSTRTFRNQGVGGLGRAS